MSVVPTLSEQQRLSELADHFTRWRSGKSKRAEPIPDALWQQAIELAKTLPIPQVSKTLRLSSQDLKKRMGLITPSKTKRPPPTSINFVDMTPLNTGTTVPATTEIELYRPDGARLRIHYTQPPPLDTLVRSFLNSP